MPSYVLQLYDTMLRSYEKITPSDGSLIRMYTCGPTIYDYAHIGNFRTFLFEDLLRRTLKLFGYSVRQVMNLTDVDDKTIRKALEQKVTLRQATDPFKYAFFEDLKTLRVEPAEHYPEATNYIPEMIQMVRELEEKGFAYKHTDKSVYFDISRARNYGKLSHLPMESLKRGASGRMLSDSYTHEGISDFVLWKAHDSQRDGSIFWESPWGPGRPGWHLECSVMARKLLGDTIDLHAGGVDLIFPHHENEIAQSESCTGKPFSLHWAHAEHLLVDHKKMSKSLGNFFTFRDLLAKGFLPTGIRFFLIGNHYRTQLNFTFQAVEAAQMSVKRIRDFSERILLAPVKESKDILLPIIEQSRHRFFSALASDLNINDALASLFEFIRIGNAQLDAHQLSEQEKEASAAFLRDADAILDVIRPDESAIPKAVQLLASQRLQARRARDWKTSDNLRSQIEQLGYLVEDTHEGQKISKVGIHSSP